MNTPNKLTLLRIIAVPIFAVLYIQYYNAAAFFVFVSASLTDTLDGAIARKRGLVTDFGKIMDPLADKILVYSAFCLMVEKGVVPAWMLIIILSREFIITGMRTVAASKGVVIAAGVSGKIKTILQMIAVAMLILGKPSWIFTCGKVILSASLAMTIYSGAEYIIKNKSLFSM